MDKYLYLLSQCISYKSRIYPKYINEEENYNILENKKRAFRASCANYKLDENFYLCYLHTKEEKKVEIKDRRKDNYHLKKKVMNMNYSEFLL